MHADLHANIQVRIPYKLNCIIRKSHPCISAFQQRFQLDQVCTFITFLWNSFQCVLADIYIYFYCSTVYCSSYGSDFLSGLLYPAQGHGGFRAYPRNPECKVGIHFPVFNFLNEITINLESLL